jgi:hypothetical protein
MSSSQTANLKLIKPATAERNWDLSLNSNFEALDRLSALGGLAVGISDNVSSPLDCYVSPGVFVNSSGLVTTFSGISTYQLTPNSITVIWLTDQGTLASGSAYPTTPQVRLATVTTNTVAILSIIDDRIAYRVTGGPLPFVSRNGDNITGKIQVVNPITQTPVLSIDPVTNSIGFFGTIGATQLQNLALLVDSTNGVSSDTINDVGSTYSQSNINNALSSIIAKIDALINALKRFGLMSN